MSNRKKIGFLEVIAGPMYCGKTEELIRQIRRAAIGKKNIKVFKHAIDTRYGRDKKLFSHAGVSFNSETVQDVKEILGGVDTKTEIVAIDEAQWFGEPLVPIIGRLLQKHVHVIVAGLAMTYDQQPFTPMPTLMAMADKVTKLSAICAICGAEAVFHKRVTKKGPKVNALEADPGFVSKLDLSVFQARCRRCWKK